VKNSHAELAFIWKVGQKMWQRDFPGVYAALNADWSENVRHIMQALLGELPDTCGVWRSCIKLPELKNCGIMDVHCYITLATKCLGGWIAFISSHMVCLSGVGGKGLTYFATGGHWNPWHFGELHITAVMQVMILDLNLLGCGIMGLPNRRAHWFMYKCSGCQWSGGEQTTFEMART